MTNSHEMLVKARNSLHVGFHHPLALERGLVRGTEVTEEDILMENREVPILHKLLRPLAGYYPEGAEGFDLAGTPSIRSGP